MIRLLAASAALSLVFGAAAACAERADYPWRLDVSAGVSGVTAGLSDWSEGTIALTHRPDDRTWLTGSLSQANQFGLTDDVFAVSAAHRFSSGLSGGLGVEGSPEANFRARYRVLGNVLLPPLWRSGRASLAFGVDGSVADYRTGYVKSAQPVVVFTYGEWAMVSARLIETWDASNRRLDGYAFSGQAPIARRVRILAGYADAPESDLGVTVPTRAVNAGVIVDLTRTFSVRLDGLREMRPAFDRTEVPVGVTELF